ncbi:MAG: N-acetylmuramoyl-L-alanine amidase family protein, partial [Gemmatimonadota bacterium]
GEAAAGTTRADTAPADTLPRAVLVLARGADTLRLRWPLDLWILQPGELPVVEARDPPSPAGTDRIVYGRPTSNGTYVWFFHDGLRLPVSGRENGRLRVQLAPELHAWIDRAEQTPLPEGTPPPRARVGTITLHADSTRVQVQVALSEPVPYLVTEDGRRIELTLYSAYAATDWVYYGESDAFVREARWRQEPGGVFVLTLDLRDEPWGYKAAYDEAGIVLTLRRPPRIDRHHPLRGRRIAVDPGHPPAGATGPTSLYEGDVNLAIARKLESMLVERGAQVILTRERETDSVPLYVRPLIAESADAEVLVSIHNNALPDGIRPFDRYGSMVFYFHPHSLDLTRALQAHLLRQLGLRDLGIGRANLALARATWMPSALTEGAFLMSPEQEAWLRTERFRERYARAVLEGIEEFLRRRARE